MQVFLGLFLQTALQFVTSKFLSSPLFFTCDKLKATLGLLLIFLLMLLNFVVVEADTGSRQG